MPRIYTIDRDKMALIDSGRANNSHAAIVMLPAALDLSRLLALG
jgi:hypothetical protein